MAFRHLWTTSVILLSALLFSTTGCSPLLEKRVELSYQALVRTGGGSGEIFLAQPIEQHNRVPLPGGKWAIGKVDGVTDVVSTESAGNWLLAALREELVAAGYQVKTGGDLSARVVKGVKVTILTLSANQFSKTLTISSVTEVKVDAQLWKNGQLVKTLTVGARDEEEGVDRSSEPIRLALQKTLQTVMQDLVPEIIKVLE